jgi:hypothetical protein
MNDAALDRLRAINPIPTDPGAPPIEDVRTRIAASEPGAPRRTRRRWRLGAVAPALGAIAVAAVVAGVAVTIHVSSRPASAPPSARGMLGQAEPYASWFEGDTGWVWFTRCTSCAGHPGRTSDWLATTSDGGGSWTTQRTHELLVPPVSGAGHDLWASALGNDAARLVGGGVIVTHDGGRRWQLANAIPSPNPYSVSVAGRVVWAVGDGCRGGCEGSVLRGRSAGSTLRRTPIMPPTGNRVRQIVAVSATSAYLYVPPVGGRAEAWVILNAGRSWSRVAPGCPADSVSGSGTGAIWRSCRPSAGHSAIGVSTDGGRHWVYRPAPFSTGILYPSSARIAWAQKSTGATVRTTDGGRRWHTVWSPLGDSRRVALSVQSASTATETVPLTHTQDGVRRTNLVVYRTTDGGDHWQQTPVPLPSR